MFVAVLAIVFVFRNYLISNIMHYSTDIFPLIHEHFLQYIPKLILILGLFIFYRVLIALFVDRLLKKIVQKMYSLDQYYHFRKVFVFSLWIIFCIACLSILIGNLESLFTSLGLIGFGLTFALQKPILNFVGWLTILVKGVYTEKDRIQVGKIVGDVKEIGVMTTVLDGLLETSSVHSGKLISFPNELVLTSDVQNFTKDSNYIVNELVVSITYESNYRKAMDILRKIIVDQVSKNRTKYIKKVTRQESKINSFIEKLLHKEHKIADVHAEIEAKKLHDEKKQIEQTLKELEEEFVPKIRLEMLDSSLQIVAQFKCPYNEVKKNRTEINLAFLDAVKQTDDIDIAYPHLQILTSDKIVKGKVD